MDPVPYTVPEQRVLIPSHVRRSEEMSYVLRELGLYLDCQAGLPRDCMLVAPATINDVRIPIWLPACRGAYPMTANNFCTDYDALTCESNVVTGAVAKDMIRSHGGLVATLRMSPGLPRMPVACGMIVFSDGVLDLRTMRFQELDEYEFEEDHCASRYFPFPFDRSLLTNMATVPELERIISSQAWSPQQALCFKAFLGRLAFPLGLLDRWDCAAVVVGQAGAGKTTLVEAALLAFHNAGDIVSPGSRPTPGFETGLLAKARVVHFSDVDASFVSKWDKDTLKKIITAEPIMINRKYEQPYMLHWVFPVIFTSNTKIAWRDDGMERRCVYFPFDNKPTDRDTTLKSKLVEPSNQVRFICHVVRSYHEVRAQVGERIFPDAAPEVYPEHGSIQQDVLMNNDPVLAYFHSTYVPCDDEFHFLGKRAVEARFVEKTRTDPGMSGCTFAEFITTVKNLGYVYCPQLKVKGSAFFKKLRLLGKETGGMGQGYFCGFKEMAQDDMRDDPAPAGCLTSEYQQSGFGS